MPNPHRPHTPQETDLAVRLYTEGATLRQVASAIRRGTDNARKVLVEAGVKIRDDGRTAPRQPKAAQPSKALHRELEAAIARDRRRNARLDIMRRASGFHALAALALLLITSCQSVSAQEGGNPQTCPPVAPAEVLTRCIMERFGEQPVHTALTQPKGHLLLVFVHPETDAWTMMETTPEGMGYLRGAGTYWTTPAIPLKGSAARFTPIQNGHPPHGEFDPYKGYQTPTGGSCCNDRDCAPAPYNPDTGLMQMPNGEWLDPLTVPGIAIYFSFDGRGHACWSSRLRCAFIPGAGT